MSLTSTELVHAANEALLVRGELDAVARYFTPDYVAHVTGRDVGGGHPTIARIVGELRAAFEDLRVEVEVLVVGEDRIAWQRTLRGVHRVSYRGFPGTGRELVWRDMATSRLEDGRIAEEWMISDLAEQLLAARKG